MAQPLVPRKPREKKAAATPKLPAAKPVPRLITKPGVYTDVSPERYHGQLTPTPSMSAGMAHALDRTCPAKMVHESYLNPDYEPPTAKHFDIGSAAHLIVLEPEQLRHRIHEVRYANYQKEQAQVQRDHARHMGKIPLLTRELAKVQAIRERLLSHPLTAKAFIGGRAEQTVVARDPKKGVWLKCRPDYAPPDWSDIVDLKTTYSAHPEALRRKAFDDGWFMRAAWYLDVIHAATGIMPNRYWFVCVETDPPYLVNLARVSDRGIGWGRKANRFAIDTFAKCLTDDTWPDYAEQPTVLDLPEYAENRMIERDDARGYSVKPSQAALEAAMIFQRPIGRG